MTKRRLKVLRIISRLNIGGPSHQAIHLTHALAARGYDTVLVAGQEAPHEGNMLDLAARHGVQPILVPELGRELDPRRDLVTLRKLVRILREQRPDIVHTHLAKAGAVGRLAAWLTGVPVVVHTYHGHVFSGYFSPAKTRFFIGIERSLARISTGLVAISPLQQREIATYLKRPTDALQVVPLGFNLTPFGTPPAGAFKQSLGLPMSTPLVGIVGRLTAIKDHELFLQAAAHVVQQHSEVRFAVVGDGELRIAIEATADRLGLRDRVIFTGWRKDMPAVFADLTLSVLTSKNEGTPTAIIESLCSQCPVVATAVGGVADLITDGSEGFLVPDRSPTTVANRILALLNDEGLRRRMGSFGRDRMLKTYSLDSLVQNIDLLYRKLWDAQSCS